MTCGAHRNEHVGAVVEHDAYAALGISNAWSIERFRAGLKVEIVKSEPEKNRLRFDLVGADPSLANALRRLMLGGVPTVAVEHVFFLNNTSVVPDETLAHRLGLVPLLCDPSAYEWRRRGDAGDATNTAVLRLKHRCVTADGPCSRLYAEALEWLPGGSELPEETGLARFPKPQEERQRCAPAAPRVLLARLRPGQEVELEAHAVVGVGFDHAKWSPVATAWYSLRPEVVLLRDVKGQDATDLAADLPGLVTIGPGGVAMVADARDHDVLLEKVRRLSGEARWSGVIELRRVRNHFQFTVETVGLLSPREVFLRAIDVLIERCDHTLALPLLDPSDDEDDSMEGG